MLTMKTRYALQALTMLASCYGNGPVLISEIAAKEKIPRRFLENILQELKSLGIVESRMGKAGGYYLTCSPSEISLLPVIQYTEGSIGLIDCVSETNYRSCMFCKKEQLCKINGLFADIRDYTMLRLSRTTLHDLACGI